MTAEHTIRTRVSAHLPVTLDGRALIAEQRLRRLGASLGERA